MSPFVEVAGLHIGNTRPFVLIGGPCALESRDHILEIATRLKTITTVAGVPFVLKASFDKANRSKITAKRGVGFDAALKIFDEVRRVGVPILTDVHEPWQCKPIAEVVDIIQIPASLCRQTDLIIAAALTGRPVNVKKGPWVNPVDLNEAVNKIQHTGNRAVLLTDRGASFGYDRMVSDVWALGVMGNYAPVLFDPTHCAKGVAEGYKHVAALARSAIAVGVAGMYIEVHEAPEQAVSDGAVAYPLDRLAGLLGVLKAIDRTVKGSLK